jgi:hypothetical protein
VVVSSLTVPVYPSESAGELRSAVHIPAAGRRTSTSAEFADMSPPFGSLAAASTPVGLSRVIWTTVFDDGLRVPAQAMCSTSSADPEGTVNRASSKASRSPLESTKVGSVVESKTEDHPPVPVPAAVVDALAAHIATYCPAGDREAFLFLTKDGTNPTRGRFARSVLQPALKRLAWGSGTSPGSRYATPPRR